MGRWKDDPLENRDCRLCNSALLDNEFHFLMQCENLKEVRTDMYLELHDKCDIDLYGKEEVVFKNMLAKDNIKIFAKHLEIMWAERRCQLYKYLQSIE